MNFKTHKIDGLPDKFNAVNKTLQNVVSELIESWDDKRRFDMIKQLKAEFDEIKAMLKGIF